MQVLLKRPESWDHTFYEHIGVGFEIVGLADAADERVGEYSKGMKMRLNFVRAVLHDP